MPMLYKMFTNEKLARSLDDSFINVSMLPKKKKDKRYRSLMASAKKKKESRDNKERELGVYEKR